MESHRCDGSMAALNGWHTPRESLAKSKKAVKPVQLWLILCLEPSLHLLAGTTDSNEGSAATQSNPRFGVRVLLSQLAKALPAVETQSNAPLWASHIDCRPF